MVSVKLTENFWTILILLSISQVFNLFFLSFVRKVASVCALTVLDTLYRHFFFLLVVLMFRTLV